jgi:hypothetical protein
MHSDKGRSTSLDELPPEGMSVARARIIEQLIARPPADVVRLRCPFQIMVAAQWQRHVPSALGAAPLGRSIGEAAKVQFLAEMYSRACYSMIVTSSRGPLLLRMAIRCACHLPLSRTVALASSPWIFSFLDRLLSTRVHRQLTLMATMMALIDQLLDDATANDPDDALKIASLLTAMPEAYDPLQITLQTLARSVREDENGWQSSCWTKVLIPAIQQYCREERLATMQEMDPTGMGYRCAGIEAAINGMWYVVGPYLRLKDGFEAFRRQNWNAEQRWMADTSLLMQMIDDWIDQDEDRTVRSTAVLSGDWSPGGIQSLYQKTVKDLTLLLNENGVRNNVAKTLLVDLYTDFIYVGLDGMKNSTAI